MRYVHNIKPLWGDEPQVALDFVQKIGDLDETDENLVFYRPRDTVLHLTKGTHRAEEGANVIIRALNTKAKRNRVIVFKKDAKLKKLIKSLPKRKDNLLFGQPGRDGQRSRYSVYDKIKRILVELGYPWASPHTFCHTFISHLVMAGVPLTTVQKLVGHADFSTTLKYAHLASDHTDEMINKRPF